MTETLLIFYVRTARRKAMACAVEEALLLLDDLEAAAPKGGPLGERGGLFWITLPDRSLEAAGRRFPRLGYTYAVDLLEPVHGRSGSKGERSSNEVSWRGVTYRPMRVYEEDPALVREGAPDRRVFALEGSDGQDRLIRGYRGDGGTLSRRALAVCDARLLVNLVHTGPGAVFLDPFAGAGGVVIEAIASGYRVLSSDQDPILRPGLERLGSSHRIANAGDLPYPSGSVDVIATEPPFDPEADGVVRKAIPELHRVLTEGGKLAVLCAEGGADGLREEAEAVGFTKWFDSPLNRKGMDCVVLAWV
ncbi:MAG: RsmD family RNA methyltransferase, partial [Armatimonadota bacterium]|nr:RsmD family RNA methyltransferase [Armatimonadota bacterium]